MNYRRDQVTARGQTVSVPMPSAAGALGGVGRAVAKVMPLGRGLFVLRYVSSGAASVVPRVAINFAPDVEVGQFIWAPDISGGVLRKIGDAVVILSPADSSLVVTIFLEGEAREDAVKLRLERLDQLSKADRVLLGETEGLGSVVNSSEGDFLPVYLSGHLSHRGDVMMPSGQWLGGKGAQEQIEGFTVHWPRRPIGVDIGYGCTVAGLGRVPETLTGDYAGTRRRGVPVTSLFLHLRDEKADQYELFLDASFSDGTSVKVSGQKVTARGQDPSSFLVGVCVLVRGKPVVQMGGSLASQPSGLQSGRVKLYRGNASVQDI